MEKHEQVTFNFGGNIKPLTITPSPLTVALAAANVDDPPRIFQFLNSNCKPIAAPFRKYSKEDYEFIREEVKQLMKDGIVEPSFSPWRAQPLVTKDSRHKRRLVIDYSQTINKYTDLDAYPLPRIQDVVNEVAKGTYFSAIDLKSAYHQVPLHPDDRAYIAFSACGSLYQFCRLPFGVTHGVSAYQRYINRFIEKFGLLGTVAYLDDITVYGATKLEHDVRLNAFLRAAEQSGLTLNKSKSTFGVRELQLLGHRISHGKIQPDPEHMKPLLEMAPPTDGKSLKRCSGSSAFNDDQ